MKNIWIAGLIGIWASTAMAHSPLESTTPADEAMLEEVPAEVVFDFKADIRLTRVAMTHAEHDSVDLDLSDSSGFVSDYVIAVQPMGSGIYVIDWRGLGVDGHALNGTFSFTVE